MFCAKCGNKIEDGAKFCGKCGNSLTVNVQTGGVQTVPTTNLSPIPPQSAAQYVQPQRNNLLIAMIILSAVAVASLGFITLFYFIHFPLPLPYYFFLQLADWFISIIAAFALVQGYTYRSNVLKISAFVALVLRGDTFFISGIIDNLFHMEIIRIHYYTFFWQRIIYLIQAAVFLVLAIHLLIKNAENRK
jgi:hypothetical protein